jgi:hypothetical protein
VAELSFLIREAPRSTGQLLQLTHYQGSLAPTRVLFIRLVVYPPLRRAEHLVVARRCRWPPLRSPLVSNAAPWASTAGNKFREVARTTENPTTKLLAEGLTYLTESLTELNAELAHVEKQIQALRSAMTVSGQSWTGAVPMKT